MGHNSTDDYLDILDQISQMDTDPNINPDDIVPKLMGFLKALYRSDLENKYSAPMVWIGMYIALASLVCIIAMVADLIHGLHSRKLWFPCRFFRINSAFLAVIAVAMKLPVDLSGSMPGDVDQAGKLGSMAFMCTMMANLLPCLATMNNNELLSNITALSILVITLVVNVCIQIHTGVVSYGENARILEYIAPNLKEKELSMRKHRNTILATTYVALSLVLLILHVCSCLAILKAKKEIEPKYKETHEYASKETQQTTGKLLKYDKLQKYVSNHWIMAGSGSPQFITACFRTTSASGVICVSISVLHTLTIYWTFEAIFVTKDWDSSYSWSMIVILMVQFIGVLIGTIAPLSRCFATLSFNMSSNIISKHFEIFEVESYWTSKLYEWKRGSMKLPFSNHRLKVVTENLKKIILSFCIASQEWVVVVCNIIALIPLVFICVLYYLGRVKAVIGSLGKKSENSKRNKNLGLPESMNRENSENSEQNKDLRTYVLQLEEKMELGDRTLESLLKSVNRQIQKGEKHKPVDLLELIKNKSTEDFPGVVNFDQSDHYVPVLLSKVKYQDCWSLPVVTLTAIAVSLQKDEGKSLGNSVRQGLIYVNHVEESLIVDDDYVSMRKEAETLWREVDVENKWLGLKLQLDASTQVKTARKVVERFMDAAKMIIHEKGSHGSKNDDSIHRHKSVCANSMYHITKTILLKYQDNIDQDNSLKVLFDQISSMIADIIAACLTNIPQVIIEKCDTKEIEKREARVKHAAQLLGETRKIVEILSERGIPNMNPSDMPFIGKWRAFKESQIP